MRDETRRHDLKTPERRLALLLLALFCCTSTAQAQQGSHRYFVDVAHSTVGLAVEHLGLLSVQGRFNTWAGTIMYDSTEVTNSSITVVIDAASLDTGHERRDADVKRDWLQVEQFPLIVFQSTSMVETEEGLELRGMLQIHGVTRAVTIPAAILGKHESTLGGIERVAFSGRLHVARADFGVVNDGHVFERIGFMGSDVEIELNVLAGRLVEPPPLRGSESGALLLYTLVKEQGIDTAVARFRHETSDSTSNYQFQPLRMAMLGFHLMDDGLGEEAVRLHRLSVETNPGDFEAVFWLGDAYARTGATGSAITQLERVLDLDPPKTGTVVPYYTDTVEMLRVLKQETGTATWLEESRDP